MKMRKEGQFYSGDVLKKEVVEREKFLLFLYGNSLLGQFARFVLTKKWFNLLCGFYFNSFLSRSKIKLFIKKYNLKMEEFEIPVGGYRTFNQFFIRRLKQGVCITDSNPNLIASPCDGKAFVIDSIGKSESFSIKDRTFYLEKFMNSGKQADFYENGILMIFRLAPYDYHRFHFPCDCFPSSRKVIKGVYNTVNPIAYKADVHPLVENERRSIILKTQQLSDVAMVAVGALCVGKIVLTCKSNVSYKKGDEVGYFEFGGSTVVLIFKQGIFCPDEKILKHSKDGFETAVRAGEPVGCRV